MSDEFRVEPIILDTSSKETPKTGSDLWENRRVIYEQIEEEGAPLISIYVQGYNRLDKTRYCVGCVLKYTSDLDFELILVDNGSEDGTYEYFQSVPWKKKTIIRVTKNIGTAYPMSLIKRVYRGKYLVGLPNDVYVTKNWLSNLLRCMESDPTIGFVMPVSSNVSNLQQISLSFETMEEMQEVAAIYNRSDPSKWEERMRLITLVNIFKREILDLVGTGDCGFAHNFSEDDYAARIRHAGYRLILCKDTWVCHDHSFQSDIENRRDDCNIGWKNYYSKYKLDGWLDICNFEHNLISLLNPAEFSNTELNALAVDVKCGTPVLEIRNRFRAAKTGHNLTSFAFTTQAKYYDSLIRQVESVECDRIDYIQEYYEDGTMDLILLGEPLNHYNQPELLIRKLLAILKEGGVLLLKVRNTYTYENLLQILKLAQPADGERFVAFTRQDLINSLNKGNVSKLHTAAEWYEVSHEVTDLIEGIAKNMNPGSCREISDQLMTKEYHCRIIK